MATSDISKEAVFDGRIYQLPARYAVDKSALSLTNSPYNAISATASQHTYNINVPSQNVWVDRAVEWTSGVNLDFNVQTTSLAANTTTPVIVYGRDFALAPFPLTSLVNTMTATINDTSVTINTDTVFKEVLRLTDYKKNRLSRTCPTMLDKYRFYFQAGTAGNTAIGATPAINSPLADYNSQTESGDQPNGAYWDVVFVFPTGTTAAVGSGFGVGQVIPAACTQYTANGTPVTCVNGIPVMDNGANPAGGYPLAIRFNSTEKLVMSPFIFADAAEWETGLFGVNNIQLVFNMKSDIARVLRSNQTSVGAADASKCISAVAYQAVPFVTPRVNVQYLTPSLDLPLPAKSVVPYMEFPRYLTTSSVTIPAGQTAVIPSTTIVLPQIPDALIIYVKPSTYGINEGDYYLPITGMNINFDNFAGLLSSHTAQQLYQMAVHNGLDMDYSMWSGLAHRGDLVNAPAAGGVALAGGRVQTTGGFLILKPGLDITLQSGQAPGLIGNFTLQFNATVFNPSAADVTSSVLYVIAINSGFFETLAGSSRIVKGVLSEADIISAEPAAEMTHEGIGRMVGHGFMDKVGSFLSRAKSIYTAIKPIVSAIKGVLPDEGKMGNVKSALGAVGYGMAGGREHDGSGAAGGGRSGGRKSLSSRLM